jgi:N utilization substance protein B
VQGLCKYRDGIDELIAKHSHNWRVERMSVVDRNILRIAVYEMEYGRDVPNQVAINEALEIAKRYSVKESIAFINGILDSVQAMLVSKQ